MAHLENKKSLKTGGDKDFNILLSDLLNESNNEFNTDLQNSERAGAREEFPLPNIKISRIIDHEEEAQNYFIDDFRPQSNMAQQGNAKSFKTYNENIDIFMSEMFDINPTKLQNSERADPREEFHLPNAKRSRIINSEVDAWFSQQTEPLITNPFILPFSSTDLNPVINEHLFDSYYPVKKSYVPYDSCEPTINTEQYFPGYNFINDLHPNTSSSLPAWTNETPPPSPDKSCNTSNFPKNLHKYPSLEENNLILYTDNLCPNTSFSPPAWTNETPPQSPEKSSNTSYFPKKVYKYPPLKDNKSILYALLTAPFKPKAPTNRSSQHHLNSSAKFNNYPVDEITVLSHNKVEVKTGENHMPSRTENNSVSGLKHTTVITSAIGNLLMSFEIPRPPPKVFVPSFKTKKGEQCPICYKTFVKKFKLKIHMNSHTGDRPYVCGTCGSRYIRSSHLIAHQRTHNPREYKCPFCPKLFSHNSDRVVHIVCQVCIALKNMLEPLKKGWNCKECGEYLDNESQLEGHIKKHRKHRICPICRSDFGQVREHVLVSHVRKYHPTWLENLGV